MTTKTNELSAYTIAKHCSDLSDIDAGMKEIEQYFKACEKIGKKPTDTAYIRYGKLGEKRNKLQKKQK